MAAANNSYLKNRQTAFDRYVEEAKQSGDRLRNQPGYTPVVERTGRTPTVKSGGNGLLDLYRQDHAAAQSAGMSRPKPNPLPSITTGLTSGRNTATTSSNRTNPLPSITAGLTSGKGTTTSPTTPKRPATSRDTTLPSMMPTGIGQIAAVPGGLSPVDEQIHKQKLGEMYRQAALRPQKLAEEKAAREAIQQAGKELPAIGLPVSLPDDWKEQAPDPMTLSFLTPSQRQQKMQQNYWQVVNREGVKLPEDALAYSFTANLLPFAASTKGVQQQMAAYAQHNPTLVGMGAFTGSALKNAVLYGTVGKAGEALVGKLAGPVIQKITSPTLQKLAQGAVSLVGQQAADTLIQTPRVILQSIAEGKDVNGILGALGQQQLEDLGANLVMMGIDRLLIHKVQQRQPLTRPETDQLQEALQKSEYFSTEGYDDLDALTKERNRLAKLNHPDLGGSTEAMQQINREYEEIATLMAQAHKAKDPTFFERAAAKVQSWIDRLKKQPDTPQKQQALVLLEESQQSILEQQTYMDQLQQAMRGELPIDKVINVGSTPSILQQYGASDLPMKMDLVDIRKNAYPEGYMSGKHNLGFYALEQLPTQLADPVAILRSSTQPNSLVVFTELLDEHNWPVMVAVHLDKESRIGLINDIASMYGRREFEHFVEVQREQGNVLYEDPRRSLEQLPSYGMQLPNIVATADPMYKNRAGIAPRSGLQLPGVVTTTDPISDTNIPQKDTGVNTSISSLAVGDTDPMNKTEPVANPSPSGLQLPRLVSTTDPISNTSVPQRAGGVNTSISSGAKVDADPLNKNRTLDQLPSSGLQLPEREATQDPIFTTSVPQGAGGVNTSISSGAKVDAQVLPQSFVEQDRNMGDFLHDENKKEILAQFNKLTPDKSISIDMVTGLPVLSYEEIPIDQDIPNRVDTLQNTYSNEGTTAPLVQGEGRGYNQDTNLPGQPVERQEGNTTVRYTPVRRQDGNREAQKAYDLLEWMGAHVVMMDGPLETVENGVSSLHKIAATGPDGTIYLNKDAVLPAEELAWHEGLHLALQRRLPEAEAFYDAVVGNLKHGPRCMEVLKEVKDNHFPKGYDFMEGNNCDPVYRELSAYVFGRLSRGRDAVISEIGDILNDMDAVEDIWRTCLKRMQEGGIQDGISRQLGPDDDLRAVQLDGRGLYRPQASRTDTGGGSGVEAADTDLLRDRRQSTGRAPQTGRSAVNSQHLEGDAGRVPAATSGGEVTVDPVTGLAVLSYKERTASPYDTPGQNPFVSGSTAVPSGTSVAQNNTGINIGISRAATGDASSLEGIPSNKGISLDQVTGLPVLSYEEIPVDQDIPNRVDTLQNTYSNEGTTAPLVQGEGRGYNQDTNLPGQPVERQEGNTTVRYTPVRRQDGNREAQKAYDLLEWMGAHVVMMDGPLETVENGVSSLHKIAATGPDGTIYLNKDAVLPAEELAWHEGLHLALQRRLPEAEAFYDAVVGNLKHGPRCMEVLKEVKDNHFPKGYDFMEGNNCDPVYRELSAYVFGRLSRGRHTGIYAFEDILNDMDAVEQSYQTLWKKMQEGGMDNGEAGQLGRNDVRKRGSASHQGVYRQQGAPQTDAGGGSGRDAEVADFGRNSPEGAGRMAPAGENTEVHRHHDGDAGRVPQAASRGEVTVDPLTGLAAPSQDTLSDGLYGPQTVGSARMNTLSYDHLQNAYGTIPAGENPARVVDVPKKDAQGRNVSQFARTVMEAESTPDAMIPSLEEEIAQGLASYDPIPDARAKARAKTLLQREGFDGALTRWQAVADGGHTASKNDIVLGETLLVEAMESGNYELATRLIAELSAEATRAGQTVQAMRMLKKLTPEGQLYYLNRAVDHLQSDLDRRFRKKNPPQLMIDAELVGKFLHAPDVAAREAVMQEIYQDIANQLPTTWLDRWNAWRYLSMLGNPRTNVRNVMGNLVFVPVVQLKNIIKTGLETGTDALLRRAGKEGIERTAALHTTKAQRQFAKTDFERMADIVTGGGKLNPTDEIRALRTIYSTDWLEKARKGTGEVLEWGDRPFLRYHYVNSMAQYMQANHLTPEMLLPDPHHYLPTRQELTAKPDVQVTDIPALSKERKISTPQFRELYRQTVEQVKAQPWYGKELQNGDELFARRYGPLRGRIAASTLKKGGSYKTPFGIEQVEILPYLDRIFENGVVIQARDAQKDTRDVDRIITLLSPVRFADGRVGVVKLNVKEYADPQTTPKIHENKILDVLDAELVELDNKKGTRPMADNHSTQSESDPPTVTNSTTSIAEGASNVNPAELVELDNKKGTRTSTHTASPRGEVGYDAATDSTTSIAEGASNVNPAELVELGDKKGTRTFTQSQSLREETRAYAATGSTTSIAEGANSVNPASLSVEQLLTFIKGGDEKYLPYQIPFASTGDALEKARTYAIREAQKATYRDANPLATKLNQFKRGGRVANILGEGLFPFTKTPLNVLKRGVEYSPIGLLKGLSYDLWQVKQGNKTAAEAIDGIAAGLTGTGIAALGMYLTAQGLLTAGSSEDGRQDQFDALQGEQNYALNIGGVSYTIDWMAPSALPLFVGSELYHALQGEDPSLSFSRMLDSLTKVSEPMFNLSMLQGFNSALKSASYGQNPLIDFFGNAVESYLGQAVPTLSGQIARTIDPTRRNGYYVDKTLPIPETVQSFVGRNLAKIPGLSMVLPEKIDQWGREMGKENLALRAFENFVSPGYLSLQNTTELEETLQQLYDATGETGVLPSYAPHWFNADGKRVDLSAQAYVTFAKTRGQTAHNLLSQLIKTEGYRHLSQAQQADVVENAYQYAAYLAKREYMQSQGETYTTGGWEDKALAASKEGIPIVTYIQYRTAVADMGADHDAQGKLIPGSKKAKVIAYIDALGLDRKQRDFLIEQMGYKVA